MRHRPIFATLLAAAMLIVPSTTTAMSVRTPPGSRLAASGACPAGQARAVGRVREVRGALQVKAAGSRRFGPARAGRLLHRGDVLRTGNKQRAAIADCDGTIVRINAASAVSLTSNHAVKVRRGEIEQLVVQGGQDHAVATPQIQAAGQDADVRVGNKTSVVTGVRGDVTVRNRHGAVKLTPNQQTQAVANAAPAVPAYADASTVTAWGTKLSTPKAAQVTNPGPNLVLNGNAEAGQGSGGGVVPVPSWQTVGAFTVVQYGQNAGPGTTDPGPPDRGTNYFAGGPDNAASSASQSVDVSGSAAVIDGGKAGFQLAAYLGGWDSQEDQAVLSATFLNASGKTLGTASIGPVTAKDRHNQTGILARNTAGAIPKGTRHITVVLEMTRESGSYNDGYADDVSLAVGTLQS